MKEKRKLIIGGTKDFGKALCELMEPNAKGIGRSNGYDINDPKIHGDILRMAKEADIVLLFASGVRQAEVAEKIAIDWIESGYDGHLIVFGSTALYHDKFNRPTDFWRYLREKGGLTTLGKYASHQAALEKNPFRYTTLQVGKLDNVKARERPNFTQALQARDVYEAIEFVTSRPKHLNIHELYMDPKY